MLFFYFKPHFSAFKKIGCMVLEQSKIFFFNKIFFIKCMSVKAMCMFSSSNILIKYVILLFKENPEQL